MNLYKNLKHIICTLIIFFLMSGVSGCMTEKSSAGIESETNNAKANVHTQEQESELNNAEENIHIQEQKSKITPEMWITAGKRIRELDNIAGIDDSAMLINGHPITKREIETQKIHSEIFMITTVKESIESLIQQKAVEAEAIRMNIYPPQEKINTYIKQVDESLKNKVKGTEMIFAYMKGMGITQDEYLSMIEESAYEMYQREALWTKVQSLQKDKDYNKYVDELVKSAKVEFIDFEVKKLLEETN